MVLYIFYIIFVIQRRLYVPVQFASTSMKETLTNFFSFKWSLIVWTYSGLHVITKVMTGIPNPWA